MPDLSQQYVPVPDARQFQAPMAVPKSAAIAPPTPDSMYGKMMASVQQQLPGSDLNAQLNTPVLTRLDETLRYTDPNIGYNPFDSNLEYKYADAHPISTFRNNIIQAGARFVGAAAESIATIPIALSSIGSDKSLLETMHNNDMTNGISDWLDGLQNSLPTYTTQYEKEHPVLKYLTPWKLGSFAGAIGSTVNNFGYTVGAIAGALVEDAVITAATGGAGLFPSIAANGIQLTKALGKIAKVMVTAPQEISALVRGTARAVDVVETGLATTKGVAKLGEVGEATTSLGGVARSEGDNIISQGVKNADEIAASATANGIQSKVNSAYNYYKVRDAVKYNLALLTSASSEAAFEAVDVRKRGFEELKKDYFDIYNHDATGDELKAMQASSISVANNTMMANIALLYISNRINWGSLFKPTSEAIKETISGFGKNIARNTLKESVDEAGAITYSVLTKTPETAIGKIFLNAEKIGTIASRSINEAVEEGSQFIISESNIDYARAKFAAKERGEVASYMKSFAMGVDKTFNTNEGWDNMVGGFVGGIFGGGIMEHIQGGVSEKQQLENQVKLMNSARFNGTFENKIQEASVQSYLGQNYKKAVEKEDVFGAKNIKAQMLYNWVASGIRANSYDKRLSELDMVRDFEGDAFKKYWGVEDNEQNRQQANTFLDGVKEKSDKIKKNVERIDYLTKNPYNPKTEGIDHEAYNSYKDELARSLYESSDYQDRIAKVSETLKKLTPNLNIQAAVNLTSIAGLRETLKNINKVTLDLASQIQNTEEGSDIQKELEAKYNSLDSISRELQPLITDTTLTDNNFVKQSGFNGAKYVATLQKLYDLHNGISFEQNSFLDNQKRLSDGNTFYIDSTSNTKNDHDQLAEALLNLQDIYKLSDANLNVQRYYNFLRQGVGLTEFSSKIKEFIANTNNLSEEERKGLDKTPAELENDIEEEIRFNNTAPENAEETTSQERETMRKAAKKTVNKEPLTQEEQDLADAKPIAFTNEVKIQQEVKKQVDEKINNKSTKSTNTENKTATEKAAAKNEQTVHSLFGMFSANRDTMQNRSNLFNAIFNSGVNGVFSKLKATFKLLEDVKEGYTFIPGTKMFRKTFGENLTITHEGNEIGILRPQDSIYLDNAGKRSIFDLTKEEYADVTGNTATSYEDFMASIKAYRESYNKLKAEIQGNSKISTNVDISKMNQQEFAQWIQDNKAYLHSIEVETTNLAGKKITKKPFENNYYELLTLRAEHRQEYINNKGILSDVSFNEAKEYYENIRKEEAKYKNSDSNPDWIQFNFGNTANTEKDGNRRKGYITIDKNSINAFKGNISTIIEALNKGLEGKYNGSFKITQKLGTLTNQFDNIVIHGANEQEVQNAFKLINKILSDNNINNTISQVGIDGVDKKGNKTSHTRLLEEKIQNNELKSQNVNTENNKEFTYEDIAKYFDLSINLGSRDQQNTDPSKDVILKNANYKPDGRILISFIDTVDNKTGKSVKSTEPFIVNAKELTPEQLAKAEAFLAKQGKKISGDVNRYAVVFPINGEYSPIGVVYARNAESTETDRKSFFDLVKSVASGKLSSEEIDQAIETIAQKHFLANADRKVKQSFTNMTFTEDGDFVINIFNAQFKVNKQIYIDKTKIQNIDDYAGLMNLVNNSLTEEAAKDPTFKKLSILINENSLKRQIPTDTAVEKLDDIADTIKLATANPDIFQNYNINFTPKQGTAASGNNQAKVTTLPKDLQGAKPRYSYGSKKFELAFKSDIDKAAYITAQSNKSKRDADYLKFAMDATGLTEAEVRTLGQQVRDTVKAIAKDQEGDTTIDVDQVYTEKKAAPTPASPIVTADPNQAKKDTITQEYEGKRRELIDARNKALTPIEQTIKEAIKTDSQLAFSIANLMAKTGATREDVQAYIAGINNFNEQITVLKNIQAQKIANLTNVESNVFAKSKVGIVTIMQDLFNLPKDQAIAVSEIYEANANAWAKRTGKAVGDYYKNLGFASQLNNVNKTSNELLFSQAKLQQEVTELKKNNTYPGEKATNLNEKNWFIVRTPTFKAWFGDWQNDPENSSKVVDKRGEPLVQYHWGPENITEFNLEGIGSHFGTKQAATEVNSNREGDTISLYDPETGETTEVKIPEEKGEFYQVFLNIRNPLKIKDEGQHGLEGNYHYGRIIGNSIRNISKEDRAALIALKVGEVTKLGKILTKYGYDGFSYKNQHEDIGSTSYIVITKNSIKSENAQAYNTQSDNILNQIIGEQGVQNLEDAKNILGNLDVAKQMNDKAMYSRGQIRTATGWELSGDNKWRYEIEDDIQFNPQAFKNFRFSVDTTLGELLKDSELLKAYPQLKDITVSKLEKSDSSLYNHTDRAIGITKNKFKIDQNNTKQLTTESIDAIKSTLIHEIQHAIQDIEGFARGANTSIFKINAPELQSLAAEISTFQNKLSKTERDEIRNALKEASIRKSFGYFDVVSEDIDKLEDGIEGLEILIKLQPKISESATKLLNLLSDRVNEAGGKNVAYEKYRSTAGEVEARNTQTRQNYTPQQRLENTLNSTEDIDEESKIYLQGKVNTANSTDTKVQQAIDLVNSGVVKGYTADILKAAINNPADFISLLNEVAQQANDPRSAKLTKELYGEELIALAKQISTDNNLLYQDAHGAYNTMTNVIYALTNPNVSTPLHEMTHSWEQHLTDAERIQVLNWAGTFTWTRETSEKFAKGFELYLTEGNKTKNTELNGLFDKFAKWLTDVYTNLKQALGIYLNDEMRDIYSKMLNSEFVAPEVKATLPAATTTETTNTTDVHMTLAGGGKGINLSEQVRYTEANIVEIKAKITDVEKEIEYNTDQIVAYKANKKAGNRANDDDYETNKKQLAEAKKQLKATQAQLKEYEARVATYNGYIQDEANRIATPVELTEAGNIDFQDNFNNGTDHRVVDSNGKVLAGPFATNAEAVTNMKTINGLNGFPNTEVNPLNTPLKDKTDYAAVSAVQKAVANGYYEGQIANKIMTADQVKEILTSAGLSAAVVEGMVFKIENPNLIESLKEGVPTGINITYLRSSINAAIKDGRFETAIKDGIITVDKAKEVLNYFGVPLTKFQAIFDAVEAKDTATLTSTVVTPEQKTEAEAALKIITENKAAIPTGEVGNLIKDLFEAEDTATITQVLVENPDIVKAINTTAEQTKATVVKDIIEPVVEDVQPTETNKYVAYTEIVDGTKVTKYGKVKEELGLITVLENEAGQEIDKLTDKLTSATKQQYESTVTKTGIEEAKYQKGDKVAYGADGITYTITDAEQRAKPVNKKTVRDGISTTEEVDSNTKEIFYTTKEGVLIAESGITGKARKTAVEAKMAIKQEHVQRAAALNRIAESFQRIFPQIKYDIGYFDFEAPARFYKGVVQVNVGYNDKRYSVGEINKINATTGYFNQPYFTRDVIAHEFMHPFILALKISNNTLYNNLVKDLNANNKDITDHVTDLIKKGTYQEETRNDEGLALYLGREMTKAFNKNGTINSEYVQARKNSIVRRFINWLKDAVNYLTGKTKTVTLEDFIKRANSDFKNQTEAIRANIYKVDALKEIYNKKYSSDIKKFVRFFNTEYNLLGEDKFITKYGIDNEVEILQLRYDTDNYINQKASGRFSFQVGVNSNSFVEFDQTDPDHIVVNMDETFSNNLSNPSLLTTFANKLDEEHREEFIKLVNDNFYKKAGIDQDKESLKVGELYPMMNLRDLSDLIVSQFDNEGENFNVDKTIPKFTVDYTGEELGAIDELEAYMELEEPEAKKIRKRITAKLNALKDTADRRLNSDVLKLNYNAITKLGLDAESDVDFVLQYMQQASLSINLGWRTYNQMLQDLAAKKGNVDKATLTRFNKELGVVRQLVSFYDEFSKYSRFKESIDSADFIKFEKSLASVELLKQSMQDAAINLTVEWFTPYITQHNKFIKQSGATDEKYQITPEQLYEFFKYGTGTDTNFITYWLGANITSRDPINATFANTIGDMLSSNNMEIANKGFDVAEHFDKFLKNTGIGVADTKAQEAYYKKHYLRQVEILSYKYNEAGEALPIYINKTALHQQYYFDKYEKDLAAVREKYKNPRNGIEVDAFHEAIEQWKESVNYGKSAQYLNKDYTALANDKYFKILEKYYNESNVKYGNDALQFGIIPQKYDVSFLEKLKRNISEVNGGKTAQDKFDITKDKLKNGLAGIKKDNKEYNLDGTLYRSLKTNLTVAKQEENISLHLNQSITEFIVEGTNYGSLKETQYQAETLSMLLEGNVKFSVPARKFSQVDFNAKITDQNKLRIAQEKLAELEDLKDENQPYDKDLYDKLTAKVEKGVESKKVWDSFLPKLKPTNTNYNNEMLIGQINDLYFGESTEEQKIGNLSANKIAHYISLYTSINSMAGNVIAGLSNVNIGNLQLFIEGHGGQYFSKKDVVNATADYVKNIPDFIKDLQSPIKSKDTQLSFMLDAIQGEVNDEFGEKISGNIAQKMFRLNSLFLLTSLGEHQIQITGMKAMMLGRKIETNSGEKINLYEAFVKNQDSRYVLRTDLKDFDKEELAKFTRDLHGVNRNLNGNYSDLNKTVLQRKWYGTLMLKFRKYLYPAFRSRWASEHIDYERNTVDVGYMRYFFGTYMVDGMKALLKKDGKTLNLNGKDLDNFQKIALRKSVFELGIYGAITIVAALMFGGDGDKKKELNEAEKYALLMLLRLRSDLGMYHADLASEFKRQIKNPTASLNSAVALGDVLTQMWHPFEIYEQKTGNHEAGDSKMAAKISKIIPLYSKLHINVDDKLGYFDLINRNIEGISRKQSTN